MQTLIRNGCVVTAVDDYRADILIEDGKVSMIGKEINVKADKKIDAKGRLVIPGGIDPHTHMELPFGGTSASDDFETGTRAAAHGGTTTIIDFAVQYKGQSLNQALDAWFKKAEGKTSQESGGEDLDRLRLPSDLHRPSRRSSAGNEGHDPAGSEQLQIVHGLSGCFSRR